MGLEELASIDRGGRSNFLEPEARRAQSLIFMR